MRQITITPLEANQRLDKFLMKYLNECPKSFIYKGMRTKKLNTMGRNLKAMKSYKKVMK